MSARNAVINGQADNKPPFKVPSMEQIKQIKKNGLNVISTFSGCGGSSLGYRMAGFDVLWASEFIEAARNVYKANADGHTIIDARDIREVKASEILTTINKKQGEIDIFDGSPPCASFSSAGKTSRHWGKEKKYSDTVQRTDDLFYEYIRLLNDIQPKTFIAENVAGLTRGVAKGYFIDILRAMKKCGYKVEARIVDAAYLGVPQHRSRTIFIGVREDLVKAPVFPKPLPYRYTLRDVLPWVKRVKPGGCINNWQRATRPAPTITASDATTTQTAYFSCGGFVEAESDISRFAIGAEWRNLKQGEASKKYFNLQRAHIDRPSPCVTQTAGISGAAGVTHPLEQRKYSIGELKRVCAFPDDFSLIGSFQQQWERLGRAVPPVMMYYIAKTVYEEILKDIKI